MTWSKLLALSPLVIAATSPQEQGLFFTGIPEPNITPASGEAIEFELVQEFGDRDEGLVFGQIVQVAVSKAGTLAVLDRFGCHIWIIGPTPIQWTGE